MIAPANIRQHEFLPASVNPCRLPANTGLNDFGIPAWPEKGLANEGIGLIDNSIFHPTHALCTPNWSPLEQNSPFPRVGEKPRVYEPPPCPEQRKFFVFDQSGNETRLMFSSLCPGVQNLPVAPPLWPVWNPQVPSAKQFDTSKFLLGRQVGKDERTCTKTTAVCEESGENENLDDEAEMREDTDEINALLYSDDDQDNDYDDEDEDDDTASSGRSPLTREGNGNKQEQQELDFDDKVAVSSMSLKRRKTFDGGHEKLPLMSTKMTGTHNSVSEKIHSGDFISALDEETSPTPGSKRPRKDKIRDTLKVLESILPGLNTKDPVSILDEAISYLKCLKYNAESMSSEDSDSSGCYDTLH
ncbi:hypothetical protein vseg_012902 [Gypsophila vaccaria]